MKRYDDPRLRRRARVPGSWVDVASLRMRPDDFRRTPLHPSEYDAAYQALLAAEWNGNLYVFFRPADGWHVWVFADDVGLAGEDCSLAQWAFHWVSR